ncbi:PREDICTED: putative F-box protein At3g03730 [Camelina sativa]|uniref:F-box protein At3g03730 n=1 Tax=Camelina sativa TaxID=90675 RepID=A0ABM0WB14_CAMSA|nr:PREDICTED: putative F-box protein At3g03730 [Camelina sativa]
MIGSDADTKCSMLVPDLSTIHSLEDVRIVKPGKIIIKGYAVSGVGRAIERLEISLDQWNSCVEASKTPKKGNNNSACVSFEATVDVAQTYKVTAKEIKVRAIVKKCKQQSDQWQTLVPDLIRSIFKRLNFVEFHRARSISLDWYSTAGLCYREHPTPWIILFSNYSHISCKLIDPLQYKTYEVKDLGFDFHRSRCLANCGSWFLMLDHRTDFYIFNLFTRERIRLPSLEAMDGSLMRFERSGEYDFMVTLDYKTKYGHFSSSKIRKVRIKNAVLWVDERTRDYLVVWNLECFIAYHKKSYCNNSWKVLQPLDMQGCCVDMVFKESKLYVLSLSRTITVYEFRGGASPNECASFSSPDFQKDHDYSLVVTMSGEVLMIARKICKFDIHKMDPNSLKWIKIDSIGNEALFLDQGTTVEAKDGVKTNCVYFSNDQLHRYNEIGLCYGTNDCVYDIELESVVQSFQHFADISLIPFKDARWFFPTFGGKLLR